MITLPYYISSLIIPSDINVLKCSYLDISIYLSPCHISLYSHNLNSVLGQC